MRILVTRFSSIGDVALCVPLMEALYRQHNDLDITFVSRPQFRSLFEPIGIEFVGAELNGQHQGLQGLYRLSRELSSHHKPEKLVDLHDVLRTRILGGLLRLKGIGTYRLNKGRAKKRALTRRYNKVRGPLAHTIERYQMAFVRAGIPVRLAVDRPELPDYRSEKADRAWKQLGFSGPVVGFAPLAAHPGKTLPWEQSVALVERLSQLKVETLLFGGPEERALLEGLSVDNAFVKLAPADLSFGEEVALMKRLKAMISMDSANMHLAALADIPVVSIWGATHADAGFGPVGQPAHLQVAISTDELSCRPCSVYGNKSCFRKDYACLNRITTDMILQKVTPLLEQN